MGDDGDGPMQATTGWINWPGLIVEMCSNRFSGIGRVQNQVEHLKLISKHGYLWISEDI